ncbi:hypothetical protein ACEUZ9_004130 [Paracoccus litorisediminis]|uniref:hypothetical protein n=1 Tax=Paracoccus litorisediminis TaxID=2006130 RepID=UPI0037309312
MNDAIQKLIEIGREDAAAGNWHEMTDGAGHGLYYTLGPVRAFVVQQAPDGEAGELMIEEVEAAIRHDHVQDNLNVCDYFLHRGGVIDCTGAHHEGIEAMKLIAEATIQAGSYDRVDLTYVDLGHLDGKGLRDHIAQLAMRREPEPSF